MNMVWRALKYLTIGVLGIFIIIPWVYSQPARFKSGNHRNLRDQSEVNLNEKRTIGSTDVTVDKVLGSFQNYMNSDGLYNATAHANGIYSDDKFRQSLRHVGVAHIPEGVPPKLIHAALRIINTKIGEMNYFKATEEGENFYRSSATLTDLEVLDLFNKSFLKHLFGHILGKKRSRYEMAIGNIYPRFPGDYCTRDMNWHIDYVDVYNTASGSNMSSIPNFDALVGILLSDSHGKRSGELCTFPSSHRALSNYYTRNPKQFENLHQVGGSYGAYPMNGPGSNKRDEVLGTEVYHCLGKAGDVFILNYMNAHFVTCNQSPYIRNNVYFRVWGSTYGDHCREELDQYKLDILRNGCSNRTSMLDSLVNWHI